MNKKFYYFIVVFPVFLIVFITSVILVLENDKYKNVIGSYNDYITEDFLNDSKRDIQRKVTFINQIIDFENTQVENMLKVDLRDKLNLAYSIVEKIYKNHNGKLPKNRLKQYIADNLSQMRYNDTNGYYFIVDLDTDIMIGHPLESFKGLDVSKNIDIKGNNRHELMKNSLKNGGLGFAKLYFYKRDGSKKEYPKLNGVVKFEPLNIMIGTGEFLDVIETKLKKKMLEKINLLNMNDNKTTVSVFALDQTNMVLKNLVYSDKNDVDYDLKQSSKQTASYMHGIVSNLKHQKEGFLSYETVNPNIDKLSKKHIYYKYHSGFNWLIVSGFYDDEFKSSIKELKKEIHSKDKEIFDKALGLTLFIIIITLVISFLVSNRMKNKFMRYTKEIQDKSDELETIFSTTKDGIAILDLQTNFLFFNDAYMQMTGFTKEELLQTSCAKLSAPNDMDKALKVIDDVITLGQVENFEKTCIVKDGRRLDVNISLSLMPDKKRILIATKDITEMKKHEKDLSDYIDLLDKYVISSTINTLGEITHISEAFSKVSGYTIDELIGQNHNIMLHPDMPDQFSKDLWATIKEDRVWVGEIKSTTKSGGFYWAKTTISPIFDQYGNKTGYMAIREDITDKKIIEEISITDGLTQIYNRRYFNEIMPKIINSAKRKDEILSFAMMDIDHFKQYNDTYGHQKGDEVLEKFAQCLKENLHRADDYCFRLGGEEFAVVYKSETKEKSLQMANKLKDSIEELKIEHKKNSASKYITASLGLYCEKACNIEDHNELYKLSDKLLYKAKESGRNMVCSNIE